MILRIEDCDTGEAMLEVKIVPKGFALSIGASDENKHGDNFTDIIISTSDARRLGDFLHEIFYP